MDNLIPALGKAGVVVIASIFALMAAKSWLFDKALDTTIAVALICGIYADAALVMMTWNSPLAYVFGFGGVAVLVALTAIPEISLLKREQEHQDEEIARLQEKVNREPRNAAAWEYLGDMLMRKRRPAEAIDAYQQALQHGLGKKDPVSGVALGDPALQAKIRKAQHEQERARK